MDPFSADFPEAIEYKLSHEGTFNCSFNQSGSLLAAGCVDGSCLIWDLDTRGVVYNLQGHVALITSITWSAKGQFLLTSSRDWNCVVWNLEDGSKESVYRFTSPILAAAIHPLHKNLIIACPQGESVFVITESEEGVEERIALKLSEDASDHIQVNCASFDRTGDKLYLGNAKGMLYIVDCETRQVLSTVKVTTGSAAIKNLQFSQQGRDLVVNSADKVIRCYSILNNNDEFSLELKHKFLDSIDQNRWVQCCFSADAEYVVGGSAAKHMHKIFLWEKASGALVKMLDGPHEGLSDFSWHPYRPILASVSTFGAIYIWTVTVHENWSAFAPDFAELEGNVEYVEREDEFDVDAWDLTVEKKAKEESSKELVDIISVAKGSFVDVSTMFVPSIHIK